MICNECKWFRAAAAYRNMPEGHKEIGICRRFPPSFNTRGLGGIETETDSFPVVHKSDGCGEFKTKFKSGGNA